MDNTRETPEDLRKVEILENDTWKQIKMKDIKPGNVYRVFNPDSTSVVWDDDPILLAVGEPFFQEDIGRWGVQTVKRSSYEKYLKEVEEWNKSNPDNNIVVDITII
jgi:hypothetical protein